MKYLIPCLWIFILPQSLKAEASSFKSQGEIKLESRLFSDDDNNSTQDYGLGLSSRLEGDYTTGSLSHRFQFFGRIDDKDDTRNVVFIEEAYSMYQTGNLELRAGYQILNWSATEAFHPADIINSRNLDSNFENAEKLGELMLSVNYLFESAGLSAYIMPQYTKPIFPQSRNRLSFSSGLTTGKALWIDEDSKTSSDEFGFQWALKFDYSFDNADTSFHVVQHMDRSQPIVAIENDQFRPLFLPVTQYGLTHQHVIEDWVVKIEAAHRDFKEEYLDLNRLDPNIFIPVFTDNLDHTQVALGIEYGFSHAPADSTFIIEAQSILGLNKAHREQVSIFQQDLLLGYRLAFNDSYSQELFISLIVDLERDHEYFVNMNYSRRLSDVWTMKTGLRYIDAPQKSTSTVGLERIDEAHQVFLDITRHF